MQKTILAAGIVGILVASSIIIIGQNYGVSTSEPAPSDMQVTSVPKTATIALQLNKISSSNGTVSIFNSTTWIPIRSLTAQLQSEMVDVSQYRTLSVLITPWTARPVNSSDTTAIFASEIEKSLLGIQTYVTFVDPDTGASTTIQINTEDTYSIPVAGPAAFVSIGSGKHSLASGDPNQITAVLHLSS